jgi:pimeloyl-ACP methyl ester carboxylesterase
VHGLCLNDLQWQRDGHDHGAALERDAAAAAQPLTALYLHYNSGLHVFANGRELAQVLEALTQAWPVPLTHLTLVGHSMGGLVVRSACAQARAGQEWPSRLREALFLGTPHAGAPLERAGHRIDRLLGSNAYTAVFARLGRIRSAGITDLRHGSILDAANGSPGARATVPLPEGVACYAIGGSIGLRPDELRERVLGDGLVPVASALGLHAGPDAGPLFAPARRATAQDVNHFGLLGSRRAYGRMRDWLLASETTLQEEGRQG